VLRIKQPKKPDPTGNVKEAGFSKRLRSVLWKIPGVTVWRQNSGKMLAEDRVTGKRRGFEGAPKGAADITGLLAPEGTRIEIETKGKRGKMRADQIKWAVKIQNGGGIYLYAPMFRDRHVNESVNYWKMALEDLIAQRRKGIEK
jgi:hypothetical protein